MTGVTRIPLFQYLFGPSKAILGKEIMIFLKIEKNDFTVLTLKGPPLWKKNYKNKFFCFLSKKAYYLYLNLNSTCSYLSFEVCNICFPQNFQIFIFLAMKFPSKTTFIL